MLEYQVALLQIGAINIGLLLLGVALVIIGAFLAPRAPGGQYWYVLTIIGILVLIYWAVLLFTGIA